MANQLSSKRMIIVCGGKGKRMGKISSRIPKAMIKLDNKTIIEHKLQYYKSQGISDYIYSVGYKAQMLKSFLRKKKKDRKELKINKKLRPGNTPLSVH